MTKIRIGEPRPIPIVREYVVLPCPFCGGEPNLTFHYADNKPCGACLRCEGCGADFYDTDFGGKMSRFDFAENLVVAWNKRVNIDSE